MSPEMSDDEKARELLIKFGVKPDELEQILVAAKTSKGKLPKLTDDEIQQIANEITSKMKESFEPSFPNNEEGKTFGKHLTDEIKDVVGLRIKVDERFQPVIDKYLAQLDNDDKGKVE